MSRHARAAKANPDQFEERIKYTFTNKAYLQEAIDISSKNGQHGYDRLEKLGDRLLAVVVTSLLTTRYPAASVGLLSQMESHLTRNENLAHLCMRTGLHSVLERKHLRLALHRKVLADCMESVFGAIALDAGSGDILQGILPLRAVCESLFRWDIEFVQISEPYQTLEHELHLRWKEHVRYEWKLIKHRQFIIGHSCILSFGSKSAKHLGTNRVVGTGYTPEAALAKGSALTLLKLWPKQFPTANGQEPDLENFSWRIKP